MQLQFEATGHYQVQILSDENIKDVREFNNLITDIGLMDWLTHGIGDQLSLGIGDYDDAIDKTMTTLPAEITNTGLVTLRPDTVITETETHYIYRYIYERVCPVETENKVYNTLATVFPKTNHLFSIAKIRNMDNELIQLELKSGEQVKIVYELRLTLGKELFSRKNTDIGYAGLTDLSISLEPGSDIKSGVSAFTTTLLDEDQTDTEDGVSVTLENKDTILDTMDDRIRIDMDEKLSYKQHEDNLLNIKTIARDLGLVKLLISMNPPINRKITTMDITMNCSLDIVKGAE